MPELTFTESILLALAFGGVAAGIGLVLLGLLYGDGLVFKEGIWPKRKDTRPDVGLDILRPRARSDRDDATADDLLSSPIVYEGRRMLDARLWGMTLEDLQDQARVQGVKGFDTMSKPQLVQALGGTPRAEDETQELPKADPDRTRPLPLIAPSPIRRGWMVPKPLPPRPIGPEPGVITREFGRITGTDPADGYGPNEDTVLARAGARYIQPAIGWVTR